MGLVLLGSLQVYSQDIMIRGRVLSEDGKSIPGANVLEKNSNLDTVTDMEGNYIQVPDEDQLLVFSFIGYVTQEIPVKGRSQIDITMKSDIQALQEVVIIGYGSVQKPDLTGSQKHGQ